MRKSAIVYTIKQIAKMASNGTYRMDSPIQRHAGVWVLGSLKSSLLIHSILAGYVIPPLYIVRECTGEVNEKGKPVYTSSVIDGKQRITVVSTYINDEWMLDVGTPNIIVDGKEVEIAGRKFSELSEDIQDEILNFNFNIYNLDDCTDEEIEECFFRLNNGVVLTKGEQSKARIGLDVARFVNQILDGKFFKEICHFTPAQQRRSADQLALMQTMLLMDYLDEEYEDFNGISESAVLEYAEASRGNYTSEKKERLKKAIDYLEKAFDEKVKFLKKINVPMVIIMADKAVDDGLEPDLFAEWLGQFARLYDPTCEYATYCGSGSVKKDNTIKRIEVMEHSFDKFMADYADSSDNATDNNITDSTDNTSDTQVDNIANNDSDTQDSDITNNDIDTCSDEIGKTTTSFTDELLNDTDE